MSLKDSGVRIRLRILAITVARSPRLRSQSTTPHNMVLDKKRMLNSLAGVTAINSIYMGFLIPGSIPHGFLSRFLTLTTWGILSLCQASPQLVSLCKYFIRKYSRVLVPSPLIHVCPHSPAYAKLAHSFPASTQNIFILFYFTRHTDDLTRLRSKPVHISRL